MIINSSYRGFSGGLLHSMTSEAALKIIASTVLKTEFDHTETPVHCHGVDGHI